MHKIPEDVKRHWRIIKELEEQTDRGVAVIGAAYLDERLAEAIAGTFTEIIETDTKRRKGIFSGPLSSFWAKIEMAFALGFYGEKSLKDLHRIRDIRNSFAHTVDPVSFTTPEIKKQCDELWYPAHIIPLGKKELSTEPREKFLDGLFMIYNFLWTEMVHKELVGNNKTPKPKPYCME